MSEYHGPRRTMRVRWIILAVNTALIAAACMAPGNGNDHANPIGAAFLAALTLLWLALGVWDSGRWHPNDLGASHINLPKENPPPSTFPPPPPPPEDGFDLERES